MVRWGWVGPEPGKAFGVTVRVKFQGCAFPLGGYFGKSTLLQPSADWPLRELEPGRLRALPGPSAGKGRANGPRQQRGAQAPPPPLKMLL